MAIFEEIYRNYYGNVYRFLLRLTGCDETLAEELTQDTFFQAFLSFQRFRGDCAMKTWLCQIAKNVHAKHVKREIRHRKFTEAQPEAPAAEAPVEEDLTRKEQLRHILEAEQRLEEPARSVFAYRLHMNMSYAEIAQQLKIREGTAAVIFNRAKAKVRKILQEEYGYEI